MGNKYIDKRCLDCEALKQSMDAGKGYYDKLQKEKALREKAEQELKKLKDIADAFCSVDWSGGKHGK